MSGSHPYLVTDSIDLTTLTQRTLLIPRGTAITQLSVRQCSTGAPLRLALGNQQLAPFKEGDALGFDPPMTDGVYGDAIGAIAGQTAVLFAALSPEGA